MVAVSGSAIEQMKEKTDKAYILTETSLLDQVLRGAADGSAYTNEFVSRYSPSVTSFSRPRFNGQIPATIIALYVSEGKNMDADPMRELRKSHVPVLDPIAFFLFSLGHKNR